MNKKSGKKSWKGVTLTKIMFCYLAAWAFGILEVAGVVAAAAAFEFDFSASSPLSESESLLSEESDESLET